MNKPNIKPEAVWKDAEKVAGCKRSDESAQVVSVLIASAIVGPSVRRICRWLKLDEGLVRVWRDRLRENGVWRGGRVYHSGWFGKDGGIALNLDAAIALGWIERDTTPPEGGKEKKA